MTFDQFWKVYPRKVGKRAAEREFNRCRHLLPPSADLEAAINRYIASKPTDIDFCHPRTWLSQGRWADEETRPEALTAAVAVPVELGEAAEPWRRTLLRRVGDEKFKSWFADLVVVDEGDASIIICTKFKADYIKTNFSADVRAAFGDRPLKFRIKPQGDNQ